MEPRDFDERSASRQPSPFASGRGNYKLCQRAKHICLETVHIISCRDHAGNKHTDRPGEP